MNEMKPANSGWSYREPPVSSSREDDLDHKNLDLSVNIWSLQFVEKSLRQKFQRALLNQRKNILRSSLVLSLPILIYEMVSHMQNSERWLVLSYSIQICITIGVFSFTFTKKFRKCIEICCILSLCLLLTMNIFNIYGFDHGVGHTFCILIDILTILLVIGMQLSFLVTAFFLIINVDLVTWMLFESHMCEATSLVTCVWLVFSGIAIVVVTYLIMLGRINMFVLLSKRQIAEKQVLRTAKQMQTQWVAQVAHDLGTPLATFSLGNQMLRDTELTEEQEDIITTQECAVELMTITRNKGMDFAKLESGKRLVPHLRPMDVRQLVETKCRRIMIGYGSENPMYFEVDDRIASQVISDRDWVWEMLINYLNNAQKFTHTGRIVVRVTLVRKQEFLRFEVADTGIGISDEQKERLFRPYSQLQRGAGGTGLGLNSVMQKARALGGSVGVRDNTQDGMGTVFWFDIPYQPDVVYDSDHNSPSQSYTGDTPFGTPTDSSKHHFECEFSKGTILVVDDQKTILKFMSKSLEKNGFQVETANNGVDALARMKQKIYQAVLLDDQMPEMSGAEVCRRIRAMEMNQSESHPRQFIVMVSGAISEIPSTTGFDKAISKPVEIKKLLKLLYKSVCSPLSSSMDKESSSLQERCFEDGCSSPKSVSFRKRFFTSAPTLANPPSRRELGRKRRSLENDSNGLVAISTTSCIGTIEEGGPQRKGSGTMEEPRLEERSLTEIPLLDNEEEKEKCKKKGKWSKSPRLHRKRSPEGRFTDLRMEDSHNHSEEEKHKVVSKDEPKAQNSRANFVLLIEDEMSILKFTSRMFQKNKFQVHTAMNGLEGLEMMKKNQYVAVFTDICMPVMDGFECVRRFRDWEMEEDRPNNSRQFICAVTANASEQDRESALATGLMDAFITKPAKVQEMIAIVKSSKCQSMLAPNNSSPISKTVVYESLDKHF